MTTIEELSPLQVVEMINNRTFDAMEAVGRATDWPLYTLRFEQSGFASYIRWLDMTLWDDGDNSIPTDMDGNTTMSLFDFVSTAMANVAMDLQVILGPSDEVKVLRARIAELEAAAPQLQSPPMGTDYNVMRNLLAQFQAMNAGECTCLNKDNCTCAMSLRKFQANKGNGNG